MTIHCVGLNHRTAPIQLREQMAYSKESMPLVYSALARRDHLRESVIVSTCNRTEIYYSTAPDEDAGLIHWLSSHHHIAENQLRPYVYLHQEDRAVGHLFRVACGLDSMVLGEPQILGQLKESYHSAVESASVGPLFNKLFHWTFSVAKRVRTHTAVGGQAVSVAYAAVRLAERLFGKLHQRTALMVGAGETVTLAARHLKEKGVSRFIFVNRTTARANALAQEFSGQAKNLSELAAVLPQADIVVSATASPVPVLGKGLIESAIKARRHQPIFMLDLAVPRDIEQEASELPDIYLYSVDDLQTIVDENLQARKNAAQEAEGIVLEEVQSFRSWLKSQAVVPTIVRLREEMERKRREELQRAQRYIRQGQDPLEVMERCSQTLMNMFLHEPTQALRNSTEDGEGAALRDTVHKLFSLDKETS